MTVFTLLTIFSHLFLIFLEMVLCTELGSFVCILCITNLPLSYLNQQSDNIPIITPVIFTPVNKGWSKVVEESSSQVVLSGSLYCMFAQNLFIINNNKTFLSSFSFIVLIVCLELYQIVKKHSILTYLRISFL